MSWPAALLWAMMIAAAFSRGPALLYLVFVCGAFGSLQMLPGNGGGTTLLPQSTCAALFVCKILAQRGNVTRGIEAALDPQKLALFTAFLVYSVLATVLLPRVFSGLFEVVPVSAFRSGTDILKPGMGNFTQSGYMIISYATTLCFAVVGQSATMRRHYLRAMLIAAYVWIATGFVDLVSFTLHVEFLLEPFRTANYAMLTDTSIDNVKRVVGLMPEASSYGASTVGMLATLIFMRPLFRTGIEQALLVGAILLLMLMAALSTSSTAYAGLGAMGLIYILDLLVRLIDPDNPRRGNLNVEISLIVLAVFALFAVFVIHPSTLDPAVTMVDRVLFQKAGTSSFEERSLWTQIGWQAFLDSGGLGAGLGSIRVSNWVVSILGSTGMFGGLLMFGFILQQLVAMPRGAPQAVTLFATVTKLSLLPILMMYQVAATIPDIGIVPAAMLGMIAATHGARRARPGTTAEAPRPPAFAGAGGPRS